MPQHSDPPPHHDSLGERIPEQQLEPLKVPVSRIVLAGIGVWALALIVTLVVPALHEGPRDWWPWACVCGIGLGAIGWAYVRRGRGNAADAQ